MSVQLSRLSYTSPAAMSGEEGGSGPTHNVNLSAFSELKKHNHFSISVSMLRERQKDLLPSKPDSDKPISILPWTFSFKNLQDVSYRHNV